MQSYVDQLMRIIGYLGIFAGGIGFCVFLLWLAALSLEKGLRYLGVLNGIAQWIWRREAFNKWLENSPQITNTVAGKLERLADYERRLDEIAERALFCVYIYPNYTMDSRGPLGCLSEILEAARPDLYERLEDGETWREVYLAEYSDEDDDAEEETKTEADAGSDSDSED